MTFGHRSVEGPGGGALHFDGSRSSYKHHQYQQVSIVPEIRDPFQIHISFTSLGSGYVVHLSVRSSICELNWLAFGVQAYSWSIYIFNTTSVIPGAMILHTFISISFSHQRVALRMYCCGTSCSLTVGLQRTL